MRSPRRLRTANEKPEHANGMPRPRHRNEELRADRRTRLALQAANNLDANLVHIVIRQRPIRRAELPEWLEPTSEGWLRTDPGMLAGRGGMDGFFVARFVNRVVKTGACLTLT